MAQQFLASGRRFKTKGLDAINPYLNKSLYSIVPTLNNMAETAEEAIDISPDDIDAGGMPTDVGFKGIDEATNPAQARAAELSGYGTAKDALGKARDFGIAAKQAAMLSPLSSLAIPAMIGYQAFAKPIASAMNARNTESQLAALGYDGKDRSTVDMAGSENKGMGSILGLGVPSDKSAQAVQIAEVENRARKEAENPVWSAVKRELFSKPALEGYENPETKGLFSIDTNASWNTEENARDRDVVESLTRGHTATAGIGKRGLFQQDISTTDSGGDFSPDPRSDANKGMGILGGYGNVTQGFNTTADINTTDPTVADFSYTGNGLLGSGQNSDTSGDTPSGMGAALGGMW